MFTSIVRSVRKNNSTSELPGILGQVWLGFRGKFDGNQERRVFSRYIRF